MKAKNLMSAYLKSGDQVDVIGTSKGRGFAGVVKRHGFGGGPKTHGQSDRLRAPGAISPVLRPAVCSKGCVWQAEWATSGSQFRTSKWCW